MSALTKPTVSVVLSGSRHCILSNPIDLGWLEQIGREAQGRRIILVGEGVTSLEYVSILDRAHIPFSRISTHQFLAVCSWEGGEEGSGKPFFLFAAPSRLIEVSTRACALGFLPGEDYFTHFDALRNRMVIDLREGGGCDANKFVSALGIGLSLPTLGGIDVLASNVTILENICSVIADRLKALHTKAVFFPYRGEQVRISGLSGFDAIEINTTHLQGQEDACEYLFETLLAEVETNKKAYLMVTEDMLKKYGTSPSGRVYHDSSHEWYFDAMLLALESGSRLPFLNIKIGKANKCLSRRMFPVLDEKLMLKKCSLYDELGRTSYSIYDIQSDEFVMERKALCERCIRFKLHRIA